jgi:glycosyltransferase involved in cell wall biosynthesis
MTPPLIVFSHLRWDFVYQRPQHLLSRIAHMHRVIFIEEPVYEEGAQAKFEYRNPCDNVLVVRPITGVNTHGFHDDQLKVLKPLVQQLLNDEALEEYMVWFYTPMALPLLAELKPKAVIYDCMDELAAFKGAPRQMRQRESALLKRADLVLTGGPSLYQGKRDLNPNVYCLPSSVDAAHYAPERITQQCEEYLAAEKLQAHILAPRIGFFGVIDERLDLELLAGLADARPDWHLVMVGPVVKVSPEHLPQRPNIHWLGQQPYARLPALVAGWDVCILPFALNEHTRFISPTKTLEYLAAEKPVVSTPVNDVVSMYGDVVRIAKNAQEFVDACAAALAETPQQRADRLVQSAATVSRFSWDESARTVLRLMAEAVERSGTTPLSGLGEGREDKAAEPVPLTPDVAPDGRATAAPRAVRHLVIGAGSAGLSATYRLAQQGEKDILVVERDERVGSNGTRALADGIVPEAQGELWLNTKVVRVSPRHRTVLLDDGRTLQYESLISTMPLPALVEACEDEAPAELLAAARTLRPATLADTAHTASAQLIRDWAGRQGILLAGSLGEWMAYDDPSQAADAGRRVADEAVDSLRWIDEAIARRGAMARREESSANGKRAAAGGKSDGFIVDR